jgi:hypothetical protein
VILYSLVKLTAEEFLPFWMQEPFYFGIRRGMDAFPTGPVWNGDLAKRQEPDALKLCLYSFDCRLAIVHHKGQHAIV